MRMPLLFLLLRIMHLTLDQRLMEVDQKLMSLKPKVCSWESGDLDKRNHVNFIGQMTKEIRDLF